MKRSVAYIRVSTKSDAQLHSYDFQEQYWKQAIANNVDEEFVGLYADWGISGRSLERRPQFLEMLEDARNGKFDIIYTKSVSRFSRNTTDLLNTIHELRELGIKVVFEKENINSLDPSADIYLTIAATVAESELRVYSENQKWSYEDRFKKGYIWHSVEILGYRMNRETNTLEIIEPEAGIVRMIYNLYLNGMSMTKIALKLRRDKVKTIYGDTNWLRSTIKCILTNIKYKGCVISQKYISINGEDYINTGQRKKYYMQNTHDAIIEPEQFDKVQSLIAINAKKHMPKERKKGKYVFTGLIECSDCHSKFSHRINNVNKKWKTEIWICRTNKEYGTKACNNSAIKDTVLKELFVEAYNEFITMRPKNIEENMLYQKLQELLDQESELNKLRVNNLLNINDYNNEKEEIKIETESILKKITSQKIKGVQVKDYVPISEFNEDKVYKFIDKIVINHYQITFIFNNGVEITKQYSNGESGNKKGWKTKQLEVK